MTRHFLIYTVLFLCCFAVARGQDSFPEKCLGNWEGVLQIYRKGQLRDSIPVSLQVKRTSDPAAYDWVTTYHAEEHPMVKAYQLKLEEPSTNTYIMVEDEDISLLMYGFDNKLYSVFETENTLLSNTYELKQDTLFFEVNSASQQATGPVVSSFQIDYLQRATFVRKDEEQ